MTYLFLNLIFVLPVLIVFLFLRKSASIAPIVLCLIALFVMTALFDNFIVGSGIVDYDPTKILGLKLGFAPVEDFAYSLVAAILIPMLWLVQGRKK
jgi:lycopene cyclase domain-containing protein